MKARVPFPSVVVLFWLLALAAPPARSADLDLIEEREIYVALDKLNAMGLLPGFLANTRPYDMQAVRAAAGGVQWSGLPVPESVAELGRWAAWRTRDANMVRGQLSAGYSREPRVEENSGATRTPDGYWVRGAALGRYEPYSWLSFDGKAMAWTGGEDGARMAGYSVQAGHKYLSLQAGKITTWYGPGRRGALVFTNNAEAYPGVRVRNPVPIPIPGFLSFLGHFQYDLFVARLDKDRPVPETMLSGFRVALRPNRYLEIGASRAMHFGGKGQDGGLDAWWDAFRGVEDDTENVRNQLGSFDVQLTLPFRVMPLQIYFEAAGEDQSRGEGIEFVPLPEKWSYMGGVFFPALFGTPNLDFRVEYADNRVYNEGGIWYTHPYSPHEYKGRILGHPMGTDARDLMLQGRLFFLPSTYLEFTFGKTDRYHPGPAAEKNTSYRTAFVGWLTPSVRAGAGILAERVKNPGGAAVGTRDEFAYYIDLSWQISGGNVRVSAKERP